MGGGGKSASSSVASLTPLPRRQSIRAPLTSLDDNNESGGGGGGCTVLCFFVKYITQFRKLLGTP